MQRDRDLLPNVLIVIINWNGKSDILECLNSLKKLDYPADKYKVLIVDNASCDGSQAIISKTYPSVLLFENKKNIGYVNAVNQGVEYGLKSGFEYIWVFNNDVVIDQQALRRLVEAGESDEKIGVLAPVIYSYQQAQQIDHIGYKINFWNGRLKELRYKKNIFQDPATDIEDVDSILGCANLIKTMVFKKVGLFKAIYELYFEETDFNIRAKVNGFRVVVVREAKVWHKRAATMNKYIFRRAYLLLRNLFIFEISNAKLKHLLVFIPYYFMIHLPFFLIRGSLYGISVKLKDLRARLPF